MRSTLAALISRLRPRPSLISVSESMPSDSNRLRHSRTVTTVTPTGSAHVTALFGDDVAHIYAPYDLPGAVSRFFERVQPRLAVVMETELWPNLFHACRRQGIPLLLDAIGRRLCRKKIHGMMRLDASQGRQRALLFDMGAVLQETPADDGGWILELEMEERDFRRFVKRENLSTDIFTEPQADEPAVSSL